MKLRSIFTLILLVTLLILAIFGVRAYIAPTETPVLPGVVSMPDKLQSTYEDVALGISVRYPIGYIVDSHYSYQALGPSRNIGGVKLGIPPEMATGTNLSSDSYLSIEEISLTTNCDADMFLDQVKSESVMDNNMQYSIASSSGAGAGNRYEEIVYALPGTNPCKAVRYFIHYGVIENYPVGVVRAFDRKQLLEQFDAIRHSLLVVQ